MSSWWQYFINRIRGQAISDVELPAQRFNTLVIVMLGIATSKRLQIAIDSFWCQRVANELIKSEMIDSEGL